jgi:hypothetical protein
MRKLAIFEAVCSVLFAGSANAMRYGLVPLPDGSVAVVTQGPIAGHESARLLSVLEKATANGRTPRMLVLSSPGGELVSAVEMGLVLRQLGLPTTVGSLSRDGRGRLAITAGECHSACVLVLMAGVERSAMPGSRIGVHSPQVLMLSRGRAFMLSGAITHHIVGRTEPLLRSYARQMGVSPAVIDLGHRVPPTRIRTLSSSELTRYRLVTQSAGGLR